MSTPGTASPGSGALELPLFSLDVQALDLGGEVKAVGLELIETQNREPVRGKDAAQIWSAVFPALAGDESYAVDFFSHIERVREFCKMREIALREAAERCVVLLQPNREQLQLIFERFEAETFGFRSGPEPQSADAALEGELSRRGLDAYQSAYECGRRFSHLTSTLRGLTKCLAGRELHWRSGIEVVARLLYL